MKNCIPPMLAGTLPRDFDFTGKSFITEEKLDGHRHLIRVNVDKTVDAWSSNLKDSLHKMDEEMIRNLAEWPPGIYDGELTLGRNYSSSDVSLIKEKPNLKFIAFDILYLLKTSLLKLSWEDRREYLELVTIKLDRCSITPYSPFVDIDTMKKEAESIWNTGGEGLILKDIKGIYEPGKRRNSFMKLKKTMSAVGIITEYIPPTTPTAFGKVKVKINEVVTSVRVPDLELKAFCLNNQEAIIDRELRIDYQNITTNGTFRHPRWDRFEDA